MNRSRERANARERSRQKSIGNAFNVLRNLLPKQLRDRKPSKAETLKSATQYISHLLRILEKEMENSQNNMNNLYNDNKNEIDNRLNKMKNISSPTASFHNKNDDSFAYQNKVWIPPEYISPCDNYCLMKNK